MPGDSSKLLLEKVFDVTQGCSEFNGDALNSMCFFNVDHELHTAHDNCSLSFTLLEGFTLLKPT